MKKYLESFDRIYDEIKTGVIEDRIKGVVCPKLRYYDRLVNRYFGITEVAINDMALEIGDFSKIIEYREQLIDRFYKEF